MQPEMARNGLETHAILSPRQEAAALAIAAGCRPAEASRRSKTAERTIKTWKLAVPAFNRRVAELRADMTSQALGRLADGMASAAETLGFLSRKGKSEMVRLSAARAVLEIGARMRETVELEERIAALEARSTSAGGRRAS